MGSNRRTRPILVLSCTVFLIFSTIASNKVWAQGSIFDYLEQALKRILASATVLNLVNYDYVSGNSLFGAYLEEGDYQSLGCNFEKNVNYFILAAGDNDILDLDLALLSSGEVLLEDTETDANPILQFTPNYSGRMTIRMTNYQSTEANEGFCVF